MHHIDKGQLRKLALSKRDNTDTVYREKSGELIAEKLLMSPIVKSAELIMCYCSFRSEVPTGEIISALEAMGKKLCFPVCGKNGIMQAWHPENRDAWKAGMMGICEPDVEKSELINPEDIELVICPMVAFDGQRRRMGYGGGYYDRYLSAFEGESIGICYSENYCYRLCHGRYDVPLGAVLTDKFVRRIKR